MSTAAPIQPLLGDYFQLKPKKVFKARTFVDRTGQAGTEPYATNLGEFYDRIQEGLELQPRFYRNNIGKTPDDLLAHTGVKHIHLGTTKSDVLLFVQEFDDFVVLLEIAPHTANFNQVPVGDTLIKNHIQSLQADLPGWAATAGAATAAAAAAAKRKAAIARARLFGKKL